MRRCEDLADALGAAGGERPDVGTPDEHGLGAQSDGLDHVAAAAHAAIEEDVEIAVHGIDDLGEDADGGGGAVERVAAVVRDGDAVDALFDGAASVFDGGDALHHEGPVPLLARPGDVVPGGGVGHDGGAYLPGGEVGVAVEGWGVGEA